MYKIMLSLDGLHDLMFACIMIAMINVVTICLHMKL